MGAHVLNPVELRAVRNACADTRYPQRNLVLVLLAFEAGLSVSEIARLRRWHVLTAAGGIDRHIHVDKTVIGQRLRPREILITNGLGRALERYFAVAPARSQDPLILSERAPETDPALLPQPMLARSLVRLFGQLFAKAGVANARSHCGRTTFAAARAKQATSIKQLQNLQTILGHVDMASTLGYARQVFEKDEVNDVLV